MVFPDTFYPAINFTLAFATRREVLATRNSVLHNTRSLDYLEIVIEQSVQRTCLMCSAALEYLIVPVNDTLFLYGNSSTLTVDHIQAGHGTVDPYYRGPDPDTFSFTTLGGLAVAAQNMFGSQVLQDAFGIQISGSLASQCIDYGWGPSIFLANKTHVQSPRRI